MRGLILGILIFLFQAFISNAPHELAFVSATNFAWSWYVVTTCVSLALWFFVSLGLIGGGTLVGLLGGAEASGSALGAGLGALLGAGASGGLVLLGGIIFFFKAGLLIGGLHLLRTSGLAESFLTYDQGRALWGSLMILFGALLRFSSSSSSSSSSD